MSEAGGVYHDGRVSLERPVRVRAAHGLLQLEGDGIAVSYPIGRVTLEPRLGDLPRRLDLPDGASCMVDAAFELPTVPDRAPLRIERWVNEAEMRWAPAIVAAVAVVGMLWAGIAFGVPAAAKLVAARMSPAVEQQMGTQSLSALERVALQPSKLSADRQARFTERFAVLTRLAGPGAECTLLFRASPTVGPNAFALPGGTIVLLDELVDTADHDDEVLAVLAHEIGHVRERHTLRQVLQTSAAGVLVAAVVGDVLSLSSYAAALPAFLLDARYSRAFEVEADVFGLALMDRAGIDRAHFVNLLTRLEKEHGGGSLPGFLSTHPRAEERGRAAER